MLVDFSVSNFGPFRDRVTLSMQATKFDEHPENKVDTEQVKNGVLTSAAIFGANSSGKSYVFHAMQALQAMVAGMYESGFRYPWYQPFRLCSENADRPVCISIRLLIDGILHVYSISYTEDRIVSESLDYYPLGRSRAVFDRSSGKGMKKSIRSNTSESTAYLTSAAKFNDDLCSKVRNEIGSIAIVFPSESNMIGYSASLIDSDPNLKKMMIDALGVADFGISGINCDAREVNYEGMGKILNQSTLELMKTRDKEMGNKAYELSLMHSFEKSDCSDLQKTFPMNIESEGTQQMFGIMGPVIDVLNRGNTIMIDGMGSRLHPLLTHWLVELFKTDSNRNGAQLIFNTHDLTLLDVHDLFRRDQIYFTNKDRDYGCSELYSLSDFKGVRLESDLIKSYLSGRFDAVPKIISREGI